MAKEEKQPSGLDAVLSFINQSASNLAVSGANARQPLGPPPGFYDDQAAFMGATRDPNFTPYINGDEWVPSFKENYEDQQRLKARMNAAGLYGSEGYTPGSWTREDANAYQQVLEAANAMGVRDANVVIDNLAESAKSGSRVKGPRAPLVSKISDPTAVRQVVRSAALELTGMRLSDEEEERIVAAYRNYQTGLDQATYNAGTSGGTVASDMGPQAFVQSQIEGTHTGDVENQRAMGFMDKILGSIGATQIQPPDQYRGQGLPQPGNEVV